MSFRNIQSIAATRIYAIGDIHGRLDLLERAVAAIHRDSDDNGPAALTVTLGDYVDRGPNSCGVLDRLIENPFPTPYAALKGNHERMFEQFLADPTIGSYWCLQGGDKTLLSYGIDIRRKARTDFTGARDRLKAVLPAAHSNFLRSLKVSLTYSRYYFCHAGVRPGVPLAHQDDEDLLWIRDEFLDSDVDFGKIVVHGHTPVPEPELRPNRIGIDTGAFASGRLTCVALEDGAARFLAF